MSLWEMMVSIFWFMLLVAWFWLMISIITDVFRDEDLGGGAKAGWCIFVILLPWLGVLVYLIARGRTMNERAVREAARREQAFRSYVKDVAVSEGTGSSGVTSQLSQLADLRNQGLLTPQEYEQAKLRTLGQAGPSGPPQQAPIADTMPA